MNGPEKGNFTYTAGPQNDSLYEEVQTLKFIVCFALLLCFVSSFIVFGYLRIQNSALNAEIAGAQHNLGQAAGIFNKLGDYAKSHADYNQQVFQKYSRELNARTPANAAPQKK